MSKINVDTWEPESGTAATLMATGDTVTVPSGATLAVASGATIANSGTQTGFGLFSSYAIIADQKGIGVQGGTFTSGAWRTRDLQTEIADPDGIVSISSNQFTLGAGSYLIRWACPSYGIGYIQSRLYNVTDTSVEGIGLSGYFPGEGYSPGSIRVVITGSKTFEVQHRASSTGTNNGFGDAASFGTEEYTLVQIFKEA